MALAVYLTRPHAGLIHHPRTRDARSLPARGASLSLTAGTRSASRFIHSFAAIDAARASAGDTTTSHHAIPRVPSSTVDLILTTFVPMGRLTGLASDMGSSSGSAGGLQTGAPAGSCARGGQRALGDLLHASRMYMCLSAGRTVDVGTSTPPGSVATQASTVHAIAHALSSGTWAPPFRLIGMPDW